jgi:hypothetical protein
VKRIKKLNIKNILERLDEQHLFAYYFYREIKIKKNIYVSPFRNDKQAGSCHFNWYKGRFLFFDKSVNKRYDVFQYLMHSENISLYESLYKVNKDFDLGLSYNESLIKDNINICANKNHIKDLALRNDRKIKQTNKRKFKVKCKRFNKTELLYWEQYGITYSDLKHFNIKSVKEYYIDYGSSWKKLYNFQTDPFFCFLYQIESRNSNEISLKLYKPLSKDYKWSSSIIEEGVCQGYNNIQRRYNKPLIITSSLKDAIVFNKMGYDSVAPSSESSYIHSAYIKEFKLLYPDVIICFDRDNTGVINNLKHSYEYDVNYLNLPYYNGLKDISDIVSKTGYSLIKEKIENKINKESLILQYI